MSLATFDTLKFANTLKAAGVPQQQAEAQAVAFSEVVQGNFKELATKNDLGMVKNELKQEISLVRTELKQELDHVRTELKQEIDHVRTELKQEIDHIRTELKQEIVNLRTELKQEMTLLRTDLEQKIESSEQRTNTRIDLLAAEVKNLRTEFKGEMTMLKWMFGVGVTIGVGILVRLFLFRGPI